MLMLHHHHDHHDHHSQSTRMVAAMDATAWEFLCASSVGDGSATTTTRIWDAHNNEDRIENDPTRVLLLFHIGGTGTGGGGGLTLSSSDTIPNVSSSSSSSSSSGEVPVVAVMKEEEQEQEEEERVVEVPRLFVPPPPPQRSNHENDTAIPATGSVRNDINDDDPDTRTSTHRRDETANNNDPSTTTTTAKTAVTADMATNTTTITTVRTIQRLWYTCAIISGFGEVSCLKSYGCFINMVTGSSVRFLLALTTTTTTESWCQALRLPLAVTVGYAWGIAGARILWWHQVAKEQDQSLPLEESTTTTMTTTTTRPKLELSFWESIRHHVHHRHHHHHRWASQPQKRRQRQNPSARLLWSGIPYILVLFSAAEIVPAVLQYCWRRPVVNIPTSLLVAGQSMGYGLVTQLLADVPNTTTPPLLPPVNVNVLTGHLTTLTKAWIDQFLRSDDNHTTTTTTTRKQKRSLCQRFQSSLVFTGAAQQSMRVVAGFGFGTIIASIVYQHVPALLHRHAILTGLAYTLTLTWYAVRLDSSTTTTTTTTTTQPTS